MNNRDFYRRTFSQLHPSKTVKWEEMQQMTQAKRTKRPLSRLVPLAAVIGLLALLGGTAVAVNFLGLRDALLPRQQEVDVIDPDTGLMVPGEKTSVDVISLSGFAGTPESKALAEWKDFLEGYDRDRAILDSVGNTIDPVLFEKYGCYGVYTQEMGEKLEEIARTYGLRLHTKEIDLYAHPEALGPLADFGKDQETYWTYMYEDGGCHFDGYAYVEGWGLVDVQFQRSVKGTFNEVILSVVDAAEYQEWSYKTASGVEVLLAMGPGKSVIMADLPDSFVVFNVFIGTDGEMTRERLEAVADCYDFNLLTPVQKPVLEEKPVQQRLYETPREAYAAVLWELWSTGKLPDGSQTEFYGKDGVMELNQFAVCDVDGDGTEELIIGYTNTYTAGQRGFVVAYDPYYTGTAIPVWVKIQEFPLFTFFENGALMVGVSHNQGLAGDALWPYTLYVINRETGFYEKLATVDAWDKSLRDTDYEGNPFPDEVDKDGDGVVYYVQPTWARGDAEPVDGAEYLEWWQSQMGEGALLQIDYQAMTEENIQALTDEPLPIYPHTMPAG